MADIATTETPAPRKPCPGCPSTPAGGKAPPLVVPRRSYTPTRPSCIECCEKHLGAAYVLLAEAREGYAYRLRAIGHLFEAEDESQEWLDLHAAIRAARKAYQADGTMPDWNILAELISEVARNIARPTLQDTVTAAQHQGADPQPQAAAGA